jgi:GNAT superfamily N-acetyltransferase
MTTRTIKTAMASDEASIVGMVVLAFGTDPAARWLYRDPHRYLTHFPSFVRAFGGKAFAHGSAHYVDGYAGAALWLPPGIHPDEDALIGLFQRTVAARDQETMFAIFEQMGRYHPDEPHCKGYGSALLTHALMRCDRDHIPAYLESSNPKNIPLYERHGFELLGTIQVGTSPPIFPMLRKPR